MALRPGPGPASGEQAEAIERLRADVLRRRMEGASCREVATELGVSANTVSRWSRGHDLPPRLAWTPEAIVAALRRFHEEFGRTPSAREWNTTVARRRHPDLAARQRSGEWPDTSIVQRVFGSWNAGIEAAGFTPRPTGHNRRASSGFLL